MDTVIHKQKDRVSVTYGRTINVGNYESVKIDVSYATDVKKDEELGVAFDRADKAAAEKLQELCAPFETKPRRK